MGRKIFIKTYYWKRDAVNLLSYDILGLVEILMCERHFHQNKLLEGACVDVHFLCKNLVITEMQVCMWGEGVLFTKQIVGRRLLPIFTIEAFWYGNTFCASTSHKNKLLKAGTAADGHLYHGVIKEIKYEYWILSDSLFLHFYRFFFKNLYFLSASIQSRNCRKYFYYKTQKFLVFITKFLAENYISIKKICILKYFDFI